MAFQEIKNRITTAPCLALVDLVDPELNFEVHIDASNHALGGVLLVEQKEGW